MQSKNKAGQQKVMVSLDETRRDRQALMKSIAVFTLDANVSGETVSSPLTPSELLPGPLCHPPAASAAH